jgi:raffinose/stachyose/melibiose transport system permease protein
MSKVVIFENRLKVANKRNKYAESLIHISKYIPIVLWCMLVLFPIFIVVFTALKTDEEYVRTSALQLPESFFNMSSFKVAFEQGNFTIAFKNSLIIVLASCFGNVVLGTMTAYCLSRFEFKLKKILNAIYIVSAMIPSITLQVSIYPIMKSIGATGTVWAPLLLYIGTDIIQIWIYLQFLNKISISLDESAMIEGASYVKIFTSIIFPLLIPASATVVIIKAVSVYNDLYYQQLYMNKASLRTVTTALMNFSGNRINAQNLMAAAIVMVMIPTVVMFLALQKYIFSGITVGAVKE